MITSCQRQLPKIINAIASGFVIYAPRLLPVNYRSSSLFDLHAAMNSARAAAHIADS